MSRIEVEAVLWAALCSLVCVCGGPFLLRKNKIMIINLDLWSQQNQFSVTPCSCCVLLLVACHCASCVLGITVNRDMGYWSLIIRCTQRTLWSRLGWRGLWETCSSEKCSPVILKVPSNPHHSDDLLTVMHCFEKQFSRLGFSFEMFFPVCLEQAKGSLIILLFFCSLFMHFRNRTFYTFKNYWVGVFLP